jgi:hypothetical protein
MNGSFNVKSIFKLIIILILLMAVGFGIWFFFKPPIKPPAEFLTARQQGAEISQKIVELTTDINQKIKEINFSDLNGDYNKASALIDEVKNKNQETLNQAVKLASEVQKMTESLDKISSPKSQELAMKAITTEISLLTNFMQYKGTLDQFLTNLNLAIAFSKIEYRQVAENNLTELNIKSGTINNLNQQFLEEMRVFDTSL